MPRDSIQKTSSYNAALTQQAKADVISQIVTMQNTLLRKSATRTDLRDVEAVKIVAENVMQNCAASGVIPNFEILAASLGCSRRNLYDFLSRHSDSPTADYIDVLRTSWAGAREAAMDRDAANATAGIFILLNSNLGYSNEHKIEIAQPQHPFADVDAAGARARLLAAMPELEDE